MSFDPAIVGFGAIVGLSLGLTGSGGSILAIPLLVYGVGLPVQQALAVSLLMVASIAAFGAVRQSFAAQVDWKAALLFSLAGMVCAPLVVAVTHDVPETLRLSLFALLMLIVAWRMAFKKTPAAALATRPAGLGRIVLGGSLAGALAGFFGVGGGFVIVPLLTLIFAMPYKKAIGTSLASIALIASAALIGYFAKGVMLDGALLATFVSGGALGLLLGTAVINKIPELAARRVFALVTAALALFMLCDKLWLHQGGPS